MAQCNSKLYFRVVFLAFLLSLVSGDCSDLDLGMESGSIPDSNITASSSLNSGTPAKNGRLNFAAGSSWCAGAGVSDPYLQIDLQTLHFICAVSTQGNSQADEWVETYTLQTSTDGITWTDYTDHVGQVKIFTGNNDRDTEGKNILYEGILTRWLRFVGKTKRGQFCMRTEVFGVKKYPVNLALKKPTAQSSTYNEFAASANAVDGVRNTNWGAIGWCTHTNWENDAWWLVDLGSNHVPVSDVFIINQLTGQLQRSKDLKITLGENSNMQSNPECVGRYSFRGFAASAVCYNNPLRTGRYVGIMHTRREILNLCEVEVYSRENLAYNKSTAQISDANSGVSSRAVDGNSDTTFSSGSCSQTGPATNPWWRVDLGLVEPVNQVYIVNRGDCCGDWLNSFEIRVGPASSDGGVTNPICGTGFSVSEGDGASFFCRPSLLGQYVTIRSTKSSSVALTLCEVEVYSARRACEMQALGLGSRRLFPDSSFSASTSRNGNEASKGRLNGVDAWSPSTDGNANDYLQINLQYEFFICAVATQGNPTSNYWTKKYKLLLSLNERDWVTYQKESGTDKIFNANDGRNDIVKHNLTNSWRARFIRFMPTEHIGRKALRVEVYGVLKPTVPFQPPDNFTVTAISTTSITASWKLPSAGSSNGVITGFKLFYKKKGSDGSENTELIIDGNTFTKTITGLLVYTEYEFQVLAFTSAGDGTKSSKLTERTKEDAPSAPAFLNHTDIAPSVQHGPQVRLTWSKPVSENGKIRSYTLFYKHSEHMQSVTTKTLTPDTFRYTVDVLGGINYQFFVRAVTIKPGTNTSISVNTREYAPNAPAFLNHTDIAPSVQHGPKVRLTWSRPVFENGKITSYTLFYKRGEDIQSVHAETLGPETFSYTVDVLGGVNYQFFVRAVTIKPGTNTSISVNTREYAPRAGPDNVSYLEVNETTFNISWSPLTRDKSYGKVKVYEVMPNIIYSTMRSKRSVGASRSYNSTKTFLVLSGLQMCSTYRISVRAYTVAGPGPAGDNLILKTSAPGAPRDLTIDIRKTEGTLEWKEPSVRPDDVIEYTVNYSGTKEYDEAFSDIKSKIVGKSTQYTVTDLVPGTSYKFKVYATSGCGDSSPSTSDVKTKMAVPLRPVVEKITEKSVSESRASIQLWPAKQRNGPISSYQVIVLKVADGVENLPDDFAERLNSSSVEKLNFYIAAEIDNAPVHKTSWEFTVGDEQPYKEYMNKKLENGQEYMVYQRAITRDNSIIFEGRVSQVATISVKGVGGDKEAQSSSSPVAAIAVPVVLVILLIPALVVAFLFYRRRKSAEKGRKDTSVHLDDIGHRLTDTAESRDNLVYSNADEVKATAKSDKTIYENFEKDTSETSANQIYQNANDIHTTGKAANQIYQNSKVETTSGQDDQIYQNTGTKRSGKGSTRPTSQTLEPVYSEAEDGKPKAVPASKFANYFKSKTTNGAAVLQDEFKNLPGGMLSPWEVAKKNKAKNRYGNIVSYDHSRVVLEPTEGDPSDYINASYIPTYDEESMCYIATQGPTSVTVSDFWRMIWQENCTIIVMLTNLVEQGKAKCHQYWPDSTSKFGAITVTLQKTENFADYVIRTLVVIKHSEKREVVQFHYTTWPDKGVPHHSTALLAFRWKVHARHQLNQGPLVVHCSAGVGRTGTYIGIDAMLESAKEQGSVFIQKYLQAMRRQRPYMVQKEEQYLFLHQAVMEALVCGNTQVSPQDLMIRMNKLARVHKSSKKTGYAEEFKRLQLVSESEDSGEESPASFKPANIDKNRFPNIVPINGSRVLLRASEPDKDYINASFVDGYTQRNAHILTQAPLDNTIEDFWRMALQYDVGTVVMLNNLEEAEESYPQYWPSAGVVTYGNVTVQILSETSSKKITTRRVSVSDAKPPKKKATVQHLQFTGWNDPNSCPDPREIISLLTAVEKSQQQTGNGIIVFQCSDGVGRSGTLSAIMSLIERIKTEQTVDVFQTIKLIRVKRPGAVVTSEQYTFCYKTILAYLDSFKTYSNFSDC